MKFIFLEIYNSSHFHPVTLLLFSTQNGTFLHVILVAYIVHYHASTSRFHWLLLQGFNHGNNMGLEQKISLLIMIHF